GHGEIIPMGYRAASYLFEDPDLARELGERMLMTDTVQRTGWLYAADASRVGGMFTERVDRRDASRPTPDPDRLRRRFAGLHPPIDRPLTRVPTSFSDDLVAQSHAPRWSRRRGVLAEDAAQPPPPRAGQRTTLAV